MALHRERRLPSSVRGPVLLSAFSRLASICLRELIRCQDGLEIGSVKLAADARSLALVSDESVPRGSWQSRADRSSGFASTMQFPVMTAAERDREFIAHLETDCSRLGKSEVVRVRRLPLADHARLRY